MKATAPKNVTSANGKEYVLTTTPDGYIYYLNGSTFLGHSGHHNTPKDAYLAYLEVELRIAGSSQFQLV